MIDDWVEFVPTRSLDRGADYFSAGLVDSLEAGADGWRATVVGSRDYSVFVPSSMDPRFSTCTCPHYQDGNTCKHIAAVLLAIESHAVLGGAREETEGGSFESVEDILSRMDEGQLRKFLHDAVSHDAALERRLRASFGTANLKAAKRDLQKATTELMRQYGRGGFIDWRNAMDFECDYRTAVDSIVQPFIASGDADALAELAVKRLVQLQRICIDDSDGFFSGAMSDVVEHLERAYDCGNDDQRAELFDGLCSFMEENPGGDRGDVYWFQRDVISDYLIERYAPDALFAPKMMAFAADQLSEIDCASSSGSGGYGFGRSRWAFAYLTAMAATASPLDDLLRYAEENDLLGAAEAVCLLADACAVNGLPRDAAALLFDHLNARGLFHRSSSAKPPKRLVDRLIEITVGLQDVAELARLYETLLLLEPLREFTSKDLTNWYDALCVMHDKEQWEVLRKRLLEEMPDSTVHTCLAHEGALEELYDRIMADGGGDLMRFESLLADVHPEPYVDHYLNHASWLMESASDRRAYRRVADNLMRAASFAGGEERAGSLASRFLSEYPRRSALADELRAAGF